MALVDFVALGQWGLRTASVGTERLMCAANPGIILLICAWLGWKTRKRSTKLLAVGAILFLCLSLGPRIYFDHARTMGGIPNPVYLLAYWCIPLVNATIHMSSFHRGAPTVCGPPGRHRHEPTQSALATLGAAIVVELTAFSAGP